LADAPLHILTAKIAGDLGQYIWLPKIGELKNTLFCLIGSRVVFSDFGKIKVENVEN
jgi:hypothetical protein